MPRPLLYGPLAEQYDRIYAEKEYDAEARELTRLARRYAPGARTLLDVACGTGRHLTAFRENFEVEGIDASPAMLRVARRRLGRSTRLTVGDMRSFDLGRTFDVLVCLFSAIGYLRTGRDRRRTFRNFARHLAPGGVMLVEGWILPAKFRQRHLALQTASVRTHDGTDVKIVRLSSSQRRGRESRIEMQYLVAEAGKPVRHYREVHLNALVEPRTMLATIRSAGLRASILRTGRFKDRGLYIGRRPTEAYDSPHSRDIARREHPSPGSDRPRV